MDRTPSEIEPLGTSVSITALSVWNDFHLNFCKLDVIQVGIMTWITGLLLSPETQREGEKERDMGKIRFGLEWSPFTQRLRLHGGSLFHYLMYCCGLYHKRFIPNTQDWNTFSDNTSNLRQFTTYINIKFLITLLLSAFVLMLWYYFKLCL